MSNLLQRIAATEKRIADIFSDNYTFTIPPYQRPYAWEVEQAAELLSDLRDAMVPGDGSEGLYFLGSIVLVKMPNNPNAKVVDGQQRLTTLTILFSVLRDLSANAEQRFTRDKYIKQRANPDEDLPERLRIQLRQHDQSFFEKVVQTTGATESLPRAENLQGSQSHIIENASFYRDHLNKMSDEERSALLTFILTKCYLVVVEVPTDTAARRIFTVLNARGLDLIATDILKADLLERAGEERETDLSTRWENMELDLGRDRFNDLFVHVRMIFQREKPRSALEVGFAESVTSFGGDPDAFLSNTLEPYADAFALAEDNVEIARLFGFKTASFLQSLNRLDNKDWVPPLLLCLKIYLAGNNNIDVPSFIAKLERLAYYLFVTRSDVNARISRYANVLNHIAPTESPAAESKGLEIDDADVGEFFEALDGGIYTKSRVVKPLMLRLELALTDGSATYDYPTISVEHVCPQTIDPDSQWGTWFADQEHRDQWTHRLANLVLLTHRKNASASNWDFDRKKTTYFKKNDACPFLLTRQVLDETEWTPDLLQKRQIEVIRALSQSWDVESEFENWLGSREAERHCTVEIQRISSYENEH